MCDGVCWCVVVKPTEQKFIDLRLCRHSPITTRNQDKNNNNHHHRQKTTTTTTTSNKPKGEERTFLYRTVARKQRHQSLLSPSSGLSINFHPFFLIHTGKKATSKDTYFVPFRKKAKRISPRRGVPPFQSHQANNRLAVQVTFSV